MNSHLWSPRRRGRRRRLVPLIILATIVFIIYRYRSSARETFKSFQKDDRKPPGSSLWPGSVMGGRWDQQVEPESDSTSKLASHSKKFKPGTPNPIGTPY